MTNAKDVVTARLQKNNKRGGLEVLPVEGDSHDTLLQHAMAQVGEDDT
jgi:hypothetical protein